MKDNLDKQM